LQRQTIGADLESHVRRDRERLDERQFAVPRDDDVRAGRRIRAVNLRSTGMNDEALALPVAARFELADECLSEISAADELRRDFEFLIDSAEVDDESEFGIERNQRRITSGDRDLKVPQPDYAALRIIGSAVG
jgi:hypothetical protein